MTTTIRRQSGCVGIVDAYGTGALLASAFHDRGWRLFHVQSRPEIPARYRPSFRASLFDACLKPVEGDAGRLEAEVAAQGPDLILAGSEPGTPLADHLAHRFGLPCNLPESSAARRDKFAMAQALVRAGLPVARHALAGTMEEAVSAAEGIGSWPVVVKPLDSGGSDGVQVCRDAQEVREAFAAIFMRDNAFDLRIDRVLVQEYLRGQQYMVNAVSLNGRHRITEIWKEDRLNLPGVGSLYDKEILLPFDGEVQAALAAYTRQVLDAVGVREGASHTELMMTDRGPILIEVGARLQGGIVEAPLRDALGGSHVDMMIRRYLDPEAFAADIDCGYDLALTAMVVNLIAPRAGILQKNNCERLFAQLPSFHTVVRTPEEGKPVERTVDLFTKAGHIYLLHHDPAQLQADYLQIREWEAREELLVIA